MKSSLFASVPTVRRQTLMSSCWISFEDRTHDREDYVLAALVPPKQRLGTKCQSVDLYQEE